MASLFTACQNTGTVSVDNLHGVSYCSFSSDGLASLAVGSVIERGVGSAVRRSEWKDEIAACDKSIDSLTVDNHPTGN